MVRIIAVTALLFFNFPVFIAYVVAYLVLEPKPGTSKYDKFCGFRSKRKYRAFRNSEESNQPDSAASVQQVWKKGRVPAQTMKKISRRYKTLEGRLQSMETYVTSKQFELRKEFQELSS